MLPAVSPSLHLRQDQTCLRKAQVFQPSHQSLKIFEEKTQPDTLIVRKRMNSEDKYDKVEYQERMEKQLLKALMNQFPVEEDDE